MLILTSQFTNQLHGQTPLEIDSLPEPPQVFQSLLREGNVDFLQGTDLLESKDFNALAKLPDEVTQALRKQSLRTDPSIPFENRLSAITTYRIDFRYARQRTWTWNPVTRIMTINMRARLTSWKPIHTVWFRELPSLTNFWKNSLVRHELDHVQLSSDANMKSRFARLLREGERKQLSLSGSQRPSNQIADETTKQWAEEKFREMIDLINVRYQELDQITRHGRNRLPEDSPLYRSLRTPESPLLN